MASKSSDKSMRAGPRKRVVPLWRTRPAMVAAALVVAGGVLGGGWSLWNSGWVHQTTQQAVDRVIQMSAGFGFRVEEILVIGRAETSRDELLAALRLERGAPMLGFDLDEAKARVEALPWVYSASIERMLPDTVLLSVVERKPLALWQHEGEFTLVDTHGTVIKVADIKRFSDLLVVVGEGAPKQAGGLIDMLKSEPQIATKVKAAVWVGGRRWNLRLDSDVDVRLPEVDPAIAWKLLANYQRTHRVLEKDIRVLDLRLPDRLIVRPTDIPDGATADGQKT